MKAIAAMMLALHLALFGMYSQNAEAIIVKGSFEGIVTGLEIGYTDPHPTSQFWSALALGKPISGTFWYEASAEAEPWLPGRSGYYSSLAAEISFLVDDVDRTIQSGADLWVQKDDINDPQPYTEDLFQLDLVDADSFADIILTSGFAHLLNGVGMIQEFSVSTDKPGGLGGAYLSQEFIVGASYNDLQVDIRRFSIGPTGTVVPEPNPLVLLLIALTVLAAEIQRRQRCKQASMD